MLLGSDVQSHAGDVLLLFPVPLPGDHLNSCYSWPDIDFRVILRLDLDESQRGNSIPQMADVGFHFVHDLCHCGLVISVSLSFC